MANFMTESFHVRVDGRAYPIQFTGDSNRTTSVEGQNLPQRGGNRILVTNWGKGDADFAKPVRDLARICSEIRRQQGSEGLEDLDNFATANRKNGGDIEALKAEAAKYDHELPSLIDTYVTEWNIVMGNAISAHIFQEDLADITRTVKQAEATIAAEKATGQGIAG